MDFPKALLVYDSSWIKCHYPDIFAAALLNSLPMGFYQPAQIVIDAKKHGVEVRPVDINHSDWDHTLEPCQNSRNYLALRLGFRQVKGLSEADARALACAEHNLAAFPEVARFHWHDVAAGLGEVGYDAVVTNPPFHSGQKTDVGLVKAFIHAAAGALKRGGRLFLVANRQLPYEAELEAAGFSWRKPAEDSTFKLLFATKR